MRAINDAIEGADAFGKMMEQVLTKGTPTRRTEILEQRVTGKTRKQRRARERAERKAARKAAV